MSEWSAHVQAFLSFLGVSSIIIFILLAWELSNEISYAVHGDGLGHSEEFKTSTNPVFTTGEYLTHKEMAIAAYSKDIQPMCTRAIHIENKTSSINTGDRFISSSDFMSYLSSQPNDINLAADNFAAFLSTLKIPYNLDSKMRLFKSPSTIGPIGQKDCYYFIDYEGVN